MIAILDYGVGNLFSLRSSLQQLGLQAVVTADADVIRVHDRDLPHLSDDDRHRVRRLQREYVELWVATLCAVDPELNESDARTTAHAVFGLINSTPYSAGRTPSRNARPVLRAMALAALGVLH